MNKLMKPASNPMLIVLSVLAVLGEVVAVLANTLLSLFLYGSSLSGEGLLGLIVDLVVGVIPLLLLTVYAFVRCFSRKLDFTLQLAHGALLLPLLLYPLQYLFDIYYSSSSMILNTVLGALGLLAMVLGFEKFRTRSIAALMALVGLFFCLMDVVNSDMFEILFDEGDLIEALAVGLIPLLVRILVLVLSAVKYTAWIVAGTGRAPEKE